MCAPANHRPNNKYKELFQEMVGGLTPARSWHGAKEMNLSYVLGNKSSPNLCYEISSFLCFLKYSLKSFKLEMSERKCSIFMYLPLSILLWVFWELVQIDEL